jgi:hypothetical protein
VIRCRTRIQSLHSTLPQQQHLTLLQPNVMNKQNEPNEGENGRSTTDKRQIEEKRRLHTLAHFDGPNRHHKRYKIHRVSSSRCQMQSRKHFRSGKTRGLNQRNGRQNAVSQSSDSENPRTQISMIPTQRKRIRLREKPLKHY